MHVFRIVMKTNQTPNHPYLTLRRSWWFGRDWN